MTISFFKLNCDYGVVFRCDHNKYMLQYLLSLAKIKVKQPRDSDDNESEEAMESCDASDSEDDLAAILNESDSASSYVEGRGTRNEL